jgi:YHS domain-containing protein
MQWLSQNATWVLLIIGAIFFLMWRRRIGSGMGAGMGCGMVGHGHSTGDGQAGKDQVLTDPVNGHPVDGNSAVRLVFDGKTYCFESEQSRAEFQGDPHRFVNRDRAHHGGC